MKTFWRWTGTIFFALAFIFLVLTAIGTSLPIDHDASCSATFDGSQRDLFAAIADDGSSIKWRPDITSAVLVSGRGPTAVWRETDVRGHAITYRTTEFVDGTILERTIDFVPGMPFGGTWTFNVDPDLSSKDNSHYRSSVSIREEGKIYNPFFRFLARYVFGYTQSMETYLVDLGKLRPYKPPITCLLVIGGATSER